MPQALKAGYGAAGSVVHRACFQSCFSQAFFATVLSLATIPLLATIPNSSSEMKVFATVPLYIKGVRPFLFVYFVLFYVYFFNLRRDFGLLNSVRLVKTMEILKIGLSAFCIKKWPYALNWDNRKEA